MTIYHPDGRTITATPDRDAVRLEGSGIGPRPLWLDDERAGQFLLTRLAHCGYRVADKQAA